MKKQSVSMPKRVTAAMLAAVMVQSSVIYTPTVALAADDATIESEAGVELEGINLLTIMFNGTDGQWTTAGWSLNNTLKAGEDLTINMSGSNMDEDAALALSVYVDGVYESDSAIGSYVYQATKDCKVEVVKNVVTTYAAYFRVNVTTASAISDEAQAVIDKIGAIGDVTYTQACKDKIEAARAAYYNLTDAQRAEVTNLSTLEAAENTYKQLDDEVTAFKKQVADITEPAEETVAAAETAYAKLTDEQKTAVADSYKSLLDLRNSLKAADVVSKIEAIGKVVYTQDSADKVLAAYNAYNAYNEWLKQTVNPDGSELSSKLTAEQVKTLTDAEDALKALQQGLYDLTKGVEELYGNVVYTPECETTITNLEKAYAALTPEQKTYFDALKDPDHDNILATEELAKERSDYEALKTQVTDLAKKIDETLPAKPEDVKYDEATYKALQSVHDDYAKLTDEQKANFPAAEYKIFTDDTDAFKALDDGINDYLELVDQIPETVVYTADCDAAIQAAEDAYDDLTAEQKAYVDQYESEYKSKVTAAREAYTKLDNEVKAVQDIIDTAYPASYTEACRKALDEAQPAYNKLTDEQKAAIENFDKLEEATTKYQQYKDDTDTVIGIIERFDVDDITCENADPEKDVEGDGAAIMALTSSFNKLKNDEAAHVDDHISAELQNKLAQIQDAYAVARVDYLIDQIDDTDDITCKNADMAEDTEGSGAAIKAARDAYDALGDADQQAKVDEYEELEAAETVYGVKHAEFLTDQIPSDATAEDFSSALKAARDDYDGLTEDQKATFKADDNGAYYEKLFGSEKANFVNLVNSIGEVELTEECANKISAAEASYQKLDDEQKKDSKVVEEKGHLDNAKRLFNELAQATLITADDVTVEDAVYTGEAVEPEVSVKVGNKVLEQGKDYTVEFSDNVEAGTATAVVKGTGEQTSGYWGTVEAKFTVKQADVSGATVAAADQVYTGYEIKPEVTVSLGGKTLEQGTDYTVSYKNNTEVGTATVTVEGKGNYSGTATGTFKIAERDLTKATVSKIDDQTYTGKAVKPAVTVTYGDETLEQGKDYTVAYSNNTNPGTATVTVVGKGAYAGTLTADFQIVDNGVKMQRLYNPYTGEHLYTSSEVEVENLKAAGWNHEGDACTAPSTGTEVHRLYNPYVEGGDHFYTTSTAEVEMLKAAGWSYEGVAWYSADAETGTPVYRAYNPYASTGTHHYTSNAGEIESLVAAGWSKEGTAWYGLK